MAGNGVGLAGSSVGVAVGVLVSVGVRVTVLVAVLVAVAVTVGVGSLGGSHSDGLSSIKPEASISSTTGMICGFFILK